MCRPLLPTKILHCPQCIKAKINSSIKGRNYLKHLFYFIFEILSHLQMLAHKIIIIIIITKKKKVEAKRKKKKKKKSCKVQQKV